MKDKVLKEYIDIALENPEIASIEVTDWDLRLGGVAKPIFKLVKRDPVVIPWQKCPKCEGQGTVSRPPHIAGDVYEWSSTQISFVCDVCEGAKIIPMKME